jgi:hypothetical protein
VAAVVVRAHLQVGAEPSHLGVLHLRVLRHGRQQLAAVAGARVWGQCAGGCAGGGGGCGVAVVAVSCGSCGGRGDSVVAMVAVVTAVVAVVAAVAATSRTYRGCP